MEQEGGRARKELEERGVMQHTSDKKSGEAARRSCRKKGAGERRLGMVRRKSRATNLPWESGVRAAST